MGQDPKRISRASLGPLPYVNLKGEDKTVPPGKYYIVGFWADRMGISPKREFVKSSQFEYFIPSRMLLKFEGVIE